jgi:hypothetical protein
VEFTSEAGATFQCRLDDGTWKACTSPYAVSDVSLGQHTISVRAIDAAGNVEATPPSVQWTAVALPGLPPLGQQTIDPPATTTPPATTPVTTTPTTPVTTTPTTPKPSKPSMRAPRKVTVKRGSFDLPCGSTCKVKATARIGKHVIKLAQGTGDAVRLTAAGRTALRKAAGHGVTTTVEAVNAGGAVERSTTVLRLA